MRYEAKNRICLFDEDTARSARYQATFTSMDSYAVATPFDFAVVR